MKKNFRSYLLKIDSVQSFIFSNLKKMLLQSKLLEEHF